MNRSRVLCALGIVAALASAGGEADAGWPFHARGHHHHRVGTAAAYYPGAMAPAAYYAPMAHQGTILQMQAPVEMQYSAPQAYQWTVTQPEEQPQAPAAAQEFDPSVAMGVLEDNMEALKKLLKNAEPKKETDQPDTKTDCAAEKKALEKQLAELKKTVNELRQMKSFTSHPMWANAVRYGKLAEAERYRDPEMYELLRRRHNWAIDEIAASMKLGPPLRSAPSPGSLGDIPTPAAPQTENSDAQRGENDAPPEAPQSPEAETR